MICSCGWRRGQSNVWRLRQPLLPKSSSHISCRYFLTCSLFLLASGASTSILLIKGTIPRYMLLITLLASLRWASARSVSHQAYIMERLEWYAEPGTRGLRSIRVVVEEVLEINVEGVVGRVSTSIREERGLKAVAWKDERRSRSGREVPRLALRWRAVLNCDNFRRGDKKTSISKAIHPRGKTSDRYLRPS